MSGAAYRTVVKLPNDRISVNPGCVVRFFRFPYRDTLAPNVLQTKADKFQLTGIVHDENPDRTLATEELDASADVISCSTTKSKDRAAGTFSMVLAPGNANYHAALHPGDHVLIFMKRDRRAFKQQGGIVGAGAAGFFGLSGIGGISGNTVDSGLKMWGVVTSVRVSRATDPNTGTNSVRYNISGEDFGHFFETDVYFNHVIAERLKIDGIRVFRQAFNWAVNLEWGSPSKNISDLLDSFIGNQINTQALVSTFATPNQNFVIPAAIAAYFGRGLSAQRLTNIVQRQIGVLEYATTSPVPKVADELTGTKFVQIDLGNAFSLWSMLQAYGNTLVNELFVDLKPDANGHLVPTFVARQMPWTSTKASTGIGLPTTRFISLPRLVLSDRRHIFAEDFGRNEQGRFNFIQIWGTGTLFDGSQNWQPEQVIHGNFALDRQSVRRYGVRAMVNTTDADLDLRSLHGQVNDPKSVSKLLKNKQSDKPSITFVTKWARLMADWFLPLHMLEAGSIQTVGIEEPLSIGDNIEIVREATKQREVYHVQSYSHSFGVDPGTGKVQFRTTMSLTRGQLETEQPIFTATQGVGDPDASHRGATNTSRSESKLKTPNTRKGGK